MNSNSTKCKELIMYKKRHTAEAYNSTLGIPQTRTVTILGLTLKRSYVKLINACKFTRRIMKEQVMNARNEACKVSANSIGLPSSCSLENVRLLDHLTPLPQQLLADSKKFQKRNGFKFCWAKNFIIYLRRTEDSRPI